MKYVMAFLVLSFAAMAPAFAQTADLPARGSINVSREKFSGPVKSLDGVFNKNKKSVPTPAQMDEAFAIYDECKASDMIERFYDCDCLSANFLEIRPLKPEARVIDLVTIAKKYCANDANIAGDEYSGCLSWAAQLGKDPETYCSCYANAYAKNFKKNPSDSIRGREVMMTMALNSCKDGTEIAKSDALDRVIDYLKQSGLYNTFFPGSNTDVIQERNRTPN